MRPANYNRLVPSRKSIRLVSWNPETSASRAKPIEAAGFRVDASPLSTSGLVGKIKEAAPAAIVIDLDRLPSHGRAVALVLRGSKSTREIPLVFAGGEEAKAARLKSEMPEAIFTAWPKAAQSVKHAIARGPIIPLNAKPYMANYSSSPLSKKLDLKPGLKAALLAAPEGFAESLGTLTENLEFASRITGDVKLALWFVRSAAELTELDFLSARLPADSSIWILFPKQSGRLRSDFKESHVRSAGLKLGLVDYKICSVDADWSGLKFKKRS